MPRVLVTHAVEDVDRWLEGNGERAAVPGVRGVVDFVAMDGSQNAGVVFEVDDLDAFKAMLASMPPDVAAQAESHGVVAPTMTAYVEA